jgi:pantothenate kinase
VSASILQEAYARRGAHWTFDAEAFVKCVGSIRNTGAADVPSFDHGIGDPVPGDIRVTPEQGIVLVEGNYLYLDEEPWLQLRGMLDDTWYVDVPLEVAMQRVFARQVALGLDPAVSKMRVAGNDQPNAMMVQATKGVAKVLVPSDIPF